MALTDNKDIIRFDSELAEGRTEEFVKGPFSEFIGKLEQIDDAGRARILLNEMGGRFQSGRRPMP